MNIRNYLFLFACILYAWVGKVVFGGTINVPCGSDIQQAIEDAGPYSVLVFSGHEDNAQLVYDRLENAKFTKLERPPITNRRKCCVFETDETVVVRHNGLTIRGLCLKLKDGVKRTTVLRITAQWTILERVRIIGNVGSVKENEGDALISVEAGVFRMYDSIVDNANGAGIRIQPSKSSTSNLASVAMERVAGASNQGYLVSLMAGGAGGSFVVEAVRLEMLVAENAVSGGVLQIVDGAKRVLARRIRAFDSFACIQVVAEDNVQLDDNDMAILLQAKFPQATRCRYAIYESVSPENKNNAVQEKYRTSYYDTVARKSVQAIYSKGKSIMSYYGVLVSNATGGEESQITLLGVRSARILMTDVIFDGGVSRSGFFVSDAERLLLVRGQLNSDGYKFGMIFRGERPDGGDFVAVDFSRATEQPFVFGESFR